MLKNVINPSFYDFSEYQLSGTVNYNDAINEAIYRSDEFRMYAYKIKRCPRTWSHDWTECPYAHRGEKAQRRDPLKVPYSAIVCPAFRNGKCPKGDTCELAHGVFEYWLHPSRYRTRACNAGVFCQRRVCFFAHTPEQFRSETKCRCPHFECKERMVDGGDLHGGGEVATAVQHGEEAPSYSVMQSNSYFGGVSEFLKSLRKLKIKEEEEKDGGEKKVVSGGGMEISSSDLSHVDWISELVN
ncbi:hypothetical protein SLEP1_g28007 [Rubroshorea leprosula]|uniref:C3H1-type domain-containing protein n=1 Tax=Rubroshorea leprosula TaxID=152421 RepID=A0AAV5JSD6_9ROSI|nr:hypothetical protein SLEP1_g28007 [Rubroshorea leprosula]